MSISSMQGRFPFLSLGTSAEYFREKNVFINWRFIYETIIVYFSYKINAISLVYMLKVLKTQRYLFWPEKCEFKGCSTLLKKALAYLTICIEIIQTQSNYNKVLPFTALSDLLVLLRFPVGEMSSNIND